MLGSRVGREWSISFENTAPTGDVDPARSQAFLPGRRLHLFRLRSGGRAGFTALHYCLQQAHA